MARKKKRTTLREQALNMLVEISSAEGWTQSDLAAELGITTKHMNRVWNGKQGMSWEMAEAWAEAIEIEFELVER